LVTRTVKGKDKFKAAAPDGLLLRPAAGFLGLFLYRYLEGIIIIIIIIIIIRRHSVFSSDAVYYEE
jgi:hypothetical protein